MACASRFRRMNGPDVEYVNAGHPDLLHYRMEEKDVISIKDTYGTFKGHPIGISASGQKYTSLDFTVLSNVILP